MQEWVIEWQIAYVIGALMVALAIAVLFMVWFFWRVSTFNIYLDKETTKHQIIENGGDNKLRVVCRPRYSKKKQAWKTRVETIERP